MTLDEEHPLRLVDVAARLCFVGFGVATDWAREVPQKVRLALEVAQLWAQSVCECDVNMQHPVIIWGTISEV